jgi:hypothetical protein
MYGGGYSPAAMNSTVTASGYEMLPGVRHLSQSEREDMHQGRIPQELLIHMRRFRDHDIVVFEPNTNTEAVLQTFRDREKVLREKLHALLHATSGTWWLKTKPTGQQKNVQRISVLLRPPYLSPYAEEAPISPQRFSLHPNEIAFIIHADAKGKLDAIRTTRQRFPVDRTISMQLYQAPHVVRSIMTGENIDAAPIAKIFEPYIETLRVPHQIP